MYYPFLRGKQEELLALQELLNSDRLCEKIIPLIEPIKLSTTFLNTLLAFCEKKRNFYIIANPIVGQFEDDLSTVLIGDETEEEKKHIERLIANQHRYRELIKSDCIKFAAYYSNDFSAYFEQEALQSKDHTVLVFIKDDDITNYSAEPFFGDERIKCSFIPSVEDVDDFDGRSVLFRDRFNKANRNADYPEDEFYSKDHLIYRKYGCEGFSDYSIVGEKYEEGGFTPYAIALHIVYPDSKNALNIRHFISDSNFSPKNPAGKFSESARKLVAWREQNSDIDTLGLSRLI